MAPEEGRAGDRDLGRLSFEELMELLESLTARMGSPTVGIEEATDLFEQAGTVHRAAAERLAALEERIERIRGVAE